MANPESGNFRDPEIIGELYNLKHGATFGSFVRAKMKWRGKVGQGNSYGLMYEEFISYL